LDANLPIRPNRDYLFANELSIAPKFRLETPLARLRVACGGSPLRQKLLRDRMVELHVANLARVAQRKLRPLRIDLRTRSFGVRRRGLCRRLVLRLQSGLYESLIGQRRQPNVDGLRLSIMF